jgi:hypothetical protein
MRAWRRGLAAAERLEMPHDQGRLHYEIGRHLPAGDPARREHLEHARACLERIGAAYDLAQVVATLKAAESSRKG